MGAATGIIGLATQGAGLFAGGGSQTVYQPNPAAKYEADMALFQRAEENSRIAKEILNGQIKTQEGFAKYQFEMQNAMMDAETQAAQNNLEAQYNMGLFNNSIQRLSNEADRYVQLTNFQLQRKQADFQYKQTLAQLGLSEDGLGIQQQGINTQRGEAQAGFNRQKASTDIQRTQLAQGAKQDEQALQFANQELDLREAGLVDTRTGINYQEQGLDLAQIQSDSAFAQELQALNTKSSEGNIQAQMAKANAEVTRQEALRQLSLAIAGNEKQADTFFNEMTGRGFRQSPQTAQLQRDLVNTDETRAGKTSLMNRYGMMMGAADLGNSMTQAQVNQSTRNTKQNKMLSDQQIGLSRGGLDLARSDADRQGYAAQLARQQAQAQFSNAQAARELQSKDLSAQEQYDVLSKSLIPAAQFDQMQQQLGLAQSGINLDRGANQSQYDNTLQGLAANQSNFNVKQGINEQTMGLQESAMNPVFQNSLQQLQGQRTMNDASNFANYQAQLGAAQQAQSAGLSQIGAQQQGLLSQIGSYPGNPPVASGGGGINWGGIGQFGQSLMGVLGQMGVGQQQQQQFEPQLMPPYSPSPTYAGYQQAPSSYNQAVYQPIAPYLGKK